MTWRVALLCMLVAGAAMLYKVPEAAIGCYLVIFLARPDGAECVGQAIGLIVLASIVVLALAPVIQVTADDPLLRIAVIAATSFAFVFLGAASQLGEIGSIIALVIAFILTLVDDVPAGEVVTRGLLYAWQMTSMPMALMIVFNLLLGTGPHRLLRDTIAGRLAAGAEALEGILAHPGEPRRPARRGHGGQRQAGDARAPLPHRAARPRDLAQRRRRDELSPAPRHRRPAGRGDGGGPRGARAPVPRRRRRRGHRAAARRLSAPAAVRHRGARCRARGAGRSRAP
ncbi:MAG: hypothetical protein QM788_00030 [Roseateles sp.]